MPPAWLTEITLSVLLSLVRHFNCGATLSFCVNSCIRHELNLLRSEVFFSADHYSITVHLGVLGVSIYCS